MNQFRIPKQTDRALLAALGAIRDGMNDVRKLYVQVTPFPNGDAKRVDEAEPQNSPGIKDVLETESQVMPHLYLYDIPSNQQALRIERVGAGISDLVTIDPDRSWINQVPAEQKAKAYARLQSLARKHLKAADIEASVAGSSDTEWSRYRDAQQAILNSLESTQTTILAEFTRKSTELETTLKAKYDGLEKLLRKQVDDEKLRLANEHKGKMDELNARDKALIDREQSFNTKEARYVARQEQKNQIQQIKDWLEGWSLTKGTREKRLPVMWAYVAGIIITLGLGILFSAQNYELLKGKDFALITWWQWVLLSLKSLVPVAASTTFIVYFIRWAGSWAREHSAEEFRNRSRVLDIGRSSWLLEAVRDAQDKGKELPPELLKELSRNLFAEAPTGDGDLHPQAITELLADGLSSIRVKAGDAEVEARRGK